MKVHRRPTFYEHESNTINKSSFKRKKNFKLSYVFLILATLYFMIIIYKAFQYTFVPVNIENLPLIESDSSEIRIQPLDAGGIVFANQDREIYNQVKYNNVEKEVAVQIMKTSIPVKLDKHKITSSKIIKQQKSVKSINNPFDVLG